MMIGGETMVKLCMSNAWVKTKDEKGNMVSKSKCQLKAIKQCRHGFATCATHNHGCKNEEAMKVN